MKNVVNGPKDVGGLLDMLDYFVWALAAAHLRPRADDQVDLIDPTQQRIAQIAMKALDYSGTRSLQVEALLRYADLMGAELRLIADSDGTRLGRPMLLVSRQALEVSRASGSLSLNLSFISDYVRKLCSVKPLDELVWGSELDEDTVRDVLSGRRTVVEELSLVCAAAGYQLRFWFMYKGAGVGTRDFCKRCPGASESAFASRNSATVRAVCNDELFALMLGDGHFPTHCQHKRLRLGFVTTAL